MLSKIILNIIFTMRSYMIATMHFFNNIMADSPPLLSHTEIYEWVVRLSKNLAWANVCKVGSRRLEVIELWDVDNKTIYDIPSLISYNVLVWHQRNRTMLKRCISICCISSLRMIVTYDRCVLPLRITVAY